MIRWRQLACFICISAALALPQEPPSTDQPLILDRFIAVPGADGRFDHMAVDAKTGRVFVAVYGNDTVSVLDVHRSREIHTIAGGLDEPQGVAYLPDLNRIVVTNSGDGSCKIFDGTTYQPLASVKFAYDADQLRYDPSKHLIYVGYGDGEIETIDALTNKITGETFDLGAHPKSFQLEQSGPRILPSQCRVTSVTALPNCKE